MTDLSKSFDPDLPALNSDAASDAGSKAIVAASDASDAASAAAAVSNAFSSHGANTVKHLPSGTADYITQYIGAAWVARKYGRFVLPGTNTLSTAVAAMSNGDCLILAPGTYTQTAQITIPTSVTRFSVIGHGIGITFIDFTSDVHGFHMNNLTSDAYRIQKALLSGFTMTMSAASTAKTAIHLWGDSSNRTVSPSITLRDINIERTDTNKYWGIGINLINAFNPQILNCYVRTWHSGATCYGTGVKLESCVNGNISGGEYFELNKVFDLAKAADAQISGASKHGCEGIQFMGVISILSNYGVYLGDKCLANKAHGCTFDFVINSGWYESVSDSSSGYHEIIGGWWAFDATNGVADNYMIYSVNDGTRINGIQIVGDATKDFNGILSLATSADYMIISNNVLRSLYWAIQVQGDYCAVNGNNIHTPQNTTDTKDIFVHSTANYTTLGGNIMDFGIADNGSNTNDLGNTVY